MKRIFIPEFLDVKVLWVQVTAIIFKYDCLISFTKATHPLHSSLVTMLEAGYFN